MKSKERDVAFVLAEYVVSLKYEHLPAEAVAATKKDILDTLAAALAGSTADGIKTVRELLLDWGGKKESTILVYGDKLPAPNAAMMNGTMAHARDYDDIHDRGVVHAGVSAIPATLAIAERRGKVTGKELITAVALGIDLMCRLGIAAGVPPANSGWHNTAIFGIFGSTAACGNLLGLDVNKMINAFGIAYSQCSGNVQCIRDSALSKRMQAGFAAKGAILSALLAEKGYTGAQNTFEGKYGLFNVYYEGFDKKALISDLGSSFEIINIGFKPYPSCRGTHNGIDAALALAQQHNINPDEIEKIIVHHGRNSLICLEPLAVRRKPHSVVDAQFSIPYTIARALTQRKVGLSDFTEQSVLDESVAKIAQKVKPHFVQELTSAGALEPIIVDIHLANNRVYSKRVDVALGDPRIQ